jgi:hypothetical protein
MTDGGFVLNRRTWLAGASSLGAVGLLPLGGCSFGSLPPLSLDGRVITPSAADYEAWRTGVVWQSRKPVRKPAMIVRPNTVEVCNRRWPMPARTN